MKQKKLKYQGREAREGKLNKVGQSWRSEYVKACLLATHEEVNIAIGPARCTRPDCNSEDNVIAYDVRMVPVCLHCGLSYEPRLGSHVPQPKNHLKSAKRFMKKIT